MELRTCLTSYYLTGTHRNMINYAMRYVTIQYLLFLQEAIDTLACCTLQNDLSTIVKANNTERDPMAVLWEIFRGQGFLHLLNPFDPTKLLAETNRPNSMPFWRNCVKCLILWNVLWIHRLIHLCFLFFLIGLILWVLLTFSQILHNQVPSKLLFWIIFSSKISETPL